MQTLIHTKIRQKSPKYHHLLDDKGLSMLTSIKLVMIALLCMGTFRFLDFYSGQVVTLSMRMTDQYGSRIFGLGIASIGIFLGVIIISLLIQWYFNIYKGLFQSKV